MTAKKMSKRQFESPKDKLNLPLPAGRRAKHILNLPAAGGRRRHLNGSLEPLEPESKLNLPTQQAGPKAKKSETRQKSIAIKTFAQADNNRAYWLMKTPMERRGIAWYLSCIAYGLDPEKQHKMDKTFFRIRKRD